MTGRVIVRGETEIIDERIVHHDTPLSWEEAYQRAGFRLDRRKAWGFVEGRLCEAVSWTESCSGCSYPDGSNEGCSECGYHGRVRRGMWVPFLRGKAV
ncbi:hypothetical protein [Sphingobium yanoikuyae]|uniref:Uncharacterized protein n=1 Tax=Sphingobium yanoikuyae TaxID=13690 RepID=A0A3G2UV22_SPHYA|nr:hypothetical protein [Sphingobium yanoikuyae]AYO76411.1 hypothetical protein EBF16_05320 [Sphingobium yanoikuyae]